MLGGQRQRTGIGMQDARIRQQLHPGALGRLDHVAVLRHALAHRIGRHQQHPAHASEGRVQAVRDSVVRLTHRDVAFCELNQ